MFIPFPRGDWMDSQEMPNKRRKKSSQKFVNSQSDQLQEHQEATN